MKVEPPKKQGEQPNTNGDASQLLDDIYISCRLPSGKLT